MIGAQTAAAFMASLAAGFLAGYFYGRNAAPAEQTKEEKSDKCKTIGAAAAKPTEEKPEKTIGAAAETTPNQQRKVRVAPHSSSRSDNAATVSSPVEISSSVEISSRQMTSRQGPVPDKRMEEADWYHGFLRRKEALRLVSNPGDFLVRTTDSGPCADVVVSAMDSNMKNVNITLKIDADGKWYIGQKKSLKSARSFVPRTFATITDLVEYYRAHPISRLLKLSRVIPKHTGTIKQEHVAYEEKDKLGVGNFCSAYKGKLTVGGKVTDVAVKKSLVAQTAVDMESEEAKESRQAMVQEMSYLLHDNIVQFYGIVCDHQPPLLVMEFCAGGDLLSHLLKHGKETDAREKLIYLYEASRGLFYLHQRRYLHRNLAARNCLISSQGIVKIADFGLNKVMEGNVDGNGTDRVRWMAPETLRKDTPPSYSRSSDVWAFGVLTYEVYSNGIKPWPDQSVDNVMAQILQGNKPKMPETTPLETVDLVDRMWAMDPVKRPIIRTIARDFIRMIQASDNGSDYPNEKMSLNKINGVKRTVFVQHVSTIKEDKFIDSSTSIDKVEQSGGKGGIRTRPST